MSYIVRVLPVSMGGTGTSTAFTQGAVVFVGAAGIYSQDPSKLFWDDTNHRLGIGTAAPVGAVTVAAPDNATVVSLSVYRSSLDYGVVISHNGASGNSTIATAGSGAHLFITADAGVGIGGGVYPGSTLNVNGLVHIGSPNAVFQSDGAQLAVRNDDPGGATVVIRGMSAVAGAAAIIGLATSTDDQEGKIVAYNENNADFNGARSVFLGANYGDFGIWGNYSGASPTPINYMTISGKIRAARAGNVGIGGVLLPPDKLTVAAVDNSVTASIGLYRLDLTYGIQISTTGASGNSSIATIGSGATLTIAAGGLTGLTIAAGAVATGGSLTIAAGSVLKLGNAYVNTPSISTGYLLVTDSAGIVYEIPAKAH